MDKKVSAEVQAWKRWRENTWLILLTVQAPVCAVCGRAAEVIDHDHETGVVRGLLCRGCNALEGGPGRDHPNHVRYREHPPTEELTEPILYVHYPGEGKLGAGRRGLLLATKGPTWNERIVGLLKEEGRGMRPAEFAERLGSTSAVMRAVLHKMMVAGVVDKTRQGWRLT